MIHKRHDEDSGNWVIEIFLEDEWYEVGQECTEEDAERVVDLLTAWALSQIPLDDSLEDI
jgi:hypothetical protein